MSLGGETRIDRFFTFDEIVWLSGGVLRNWREALRVRTAWALAAAPFIMLQVLLIWLMYLVEVVRFAIQIGFAETIMTISHMMGSVRRINDRLIGEVPLDPP